MQKTRIQLCGTLAATIAGARVDEALPGRQGKLLFVFLVLNRTRRVTREELIAALWREPPPTADQTLNSLLSRLRRALGADTVQGRSELRLELPADTWVDIEAAIESVHRAESAVATEDWAAAWVPARVAQHVTSRVLLPREDLPWIDEKRRLLQQTRVRSLECLAAASLGLGGSEIPVAERSSRKLIDLEPYRESGYRLLMEALIAQDNVAEALLVFDRLRLFLHEELGVAPGARIQKLHQSLLRRAG